MEVFAQDDACLAPAMDELKRAVSYSGEAPEKESLIYKAIDSEFAGSFQPDIAFVS
jgi:hypothetical protein